MIPFVADPDFTLYVGDALDVLRELPDESVHCAATSPPFYALRDYGVEGQIGLEETPELWADRLVEVFREVRRVLRSDGTLWVECGDSYVSGQGGRQSAVGELPPTTRFDRKEAGEKREGLPSSFGERDVGPRFYPGRDTGLKPKDLLGQPWLLAFALRADGWWLRQAIIWHKPNAMPESATDRCTTAHSYVFLLSKSARYHFDAEAIAEPAEWARWGDQTVPKYEGTPTAAGWIKPKTKQELTGEGRPGAKGDTYSGFNERWKATGRKGNGQRERTDEMRGFDERRDREDGKKNPRSVWTIPTRGYSEAHFATWPEALCERIIKAGCPEWVCAKCGKARERIGEVTYEADGSGGTMSRRGDATRAPDTRTDLPMERLSKRTETVGWTDCGCGAGFVPGIVLDPFVGSGTTALVARRLGRRSVGIELNPEYARLAADRLSQLSLLADESAA